MSGEPAGLLAGIEGQHAGVSHRVTVNQPRKWSSKARLCGRTEDLRCTEMVSDSIKGRSTGSSKRLMGLEPTTFCMASRPASRTSCQLSPANELFLAAGRGQPGLPGFVPFARGSVPQLSPCVRARHGGGEASERCLTQPRLRCAEPVAAPGVIARHAGYLVRGVKAGRMLLAPLAVLVVGGRFTFRMRLRPNDS
jgi:hypothetical protein